MRCFQALGGHLGPRFSSVLLSSPRFSLVLLSSPQFSSVLQGSPWFSSVFPSPASRRPKSRLIGLQGCWSVSGAKRSSLNKNDSSTNHFLLEGTESSRTSASIVPLSVNVTDIIDYISVINGTNSQSFSWKTTKFPKVLTDHRENCGWISTWFWSFRTSSEEPQSEEEEETRDEVLPFPCEMGELFFMTSYSKCVCLIWQTVVAPSEKVDFWNLVILNRKRVKNWSQRSRNFFVGVSADGRR